jgi:hypothetical protein
VGLFLSTSVPAGDTMSAEQLKALLVGSTVDAEHLKKGFTFKVYFDASGKAYRTDGGDIVETTYKIDNDGKHCLYWKGKDRCATVKDNGDGTYFRMKDGKKSIKWSNIQKGKHI